MESEIPLVEMENGCENGFGGEVSSVDLECERVETGSSLWRSLAFRTLRGWQVQGNKVPKWTARWHE